MRGASIYVPLSRYRKFSDINLLRPLWTEGSAKEKRHAIERILHALTLAPSLVSELHRLETLAEPTHQRHSGLLEQLKARGH